MRSTNVEEEVVKIINDNLRALEGVLNQAVKILDNQGNTQLYLIANALRLETKAEIDDCFDNTTSNEQRIEIGLAAREPILQYIAYLKKEVENNFGNLPLELSILDAKLDIKSVFHIYPSINAYFKDTQEAAKENHHANYTTTIVTKAGKIIENAMSDIKKLRKELSRQYQQEIIPKIIQSHPGTVDSAKAVVMPASANLLETIRDFQASFSSKEKILTKLQDLSASYGRKTGFFGGMSELNRQRLRILSETINLIKNEHSEINIPTHLVNLLVKNMQAVNTLARVNKNNYGDLHKQICEMFPLLKKLAEEEFKRQLQQISPRKELKN